MIVFTYPYSSFAQNKDELSYMIISFDGMRYDFTEDYINDGLMPHFKKMQDHALVADDIRTIYPSLTMSSHAAIATGSEPGKTGMISNHIHKPGTELYENESAFFAPIDVPPLWSEARRQGKTTATVLFPGANPKEGNQATYAIYADTVWAKSALENLEFHSPADWKELPKSDSPVKEATFTVKLKDAPDREIYILAGDSTGNKQINYDTFYFYTEKNGDVMDTISVEEWGSLSFTIDSDDLAGFSFKLKNADPKLKNMKLYRTAVNSAVIKGPEDFKEDIESEFGHLPAEYDDEALEEGWITRSEYEAIQEYFAKWTTDVSLYIKEQYSPDMLFFYYPQIDHEEHKYLLVDPKQPGYTSSKSKAFLEYITWSYQLADRVVGEVVDDLTSEDRLLIVSDHGMEPVHTEVSPNHELEKAGLLVRDENDKIDSKKSKAYAIASGAIAHIFVNLEGREKGGIVTEEELPDMQKEIEEIFSEFKAKAPSFMSRLQYLFYRWSDDIRDEDEKSIFEVLMGKTENPFEKVVSADDKEYMEFLQHKLAGDVLLIAKRGYYLAQDDNESTMKTAEERGNHGGDPERDALHPVLFMTGGSYTKGRITKKISTLDIAPTLYELMDLEIPDFVDGKVISEIIEAERK